ncbi:DUF4365 domain-containing protein [Flavihumibacter petaseus]|uniref:DUF4365 domain-containing protein n=1 Tax=Flavihumibacter petaseus NBRC 106054 TaxID=1220578 RepID=A0A0E9N300_9BACT|nr:DUF4365 domain-containing protein [Flavihumibacter petaseus]GAO43730.1 hypothetical protein FPE01S_02_08360 [Flavihumibacter petaseus NBRC 106054]
MPEFNPTERIGVNAVEAIFLKDFKWIFREQPISDMGIDAHVEIANEGIPTGQLISLQIKTGESHFQSNEDHLIYYGSSRHLEYWVNHSLPVILIAHLPNTNETFWELVTLKNVNFTKKAWKINIPRKQVLSSIFLDELMQIGGGTEEMLRKRKLFIDKPLMDVIKQEGKVSVVFMEWLHKSLNRTQISIIITKKGKESTAREWAVAYAGYETEEIMRLIFPWAEATIDEDFYDEHLDEDSLSGTYNLDWLYKQEFYPYRVQMDEVADFRLQLSLNELGKGFLNYIDFVENGKTF